MDGKARLVGINHVALEVSDLDAALDLYGRLFGFDLRGRVRGMAFIDMGDQFLAVAEGRSQGPDDGRHFGLVVDDVDAARAAVARKGPSGCSAAAGRASTSATRGATASRSSATATSSSSGRRGCGASSTSRTSGRPTPPAEEISDRGLCMTLYHQGCANSRTALTRAASPTASRG